MAYSIFDVPRPSSQTPVKTVKSPDAMVSLAPTSCPPKAAIIPEKTASDTPKAKTAARFSIFGSQPTEPVVRKPTTPGPSASAGKAIAAEKDEPAATRTSASTAATPDRAATVKSKPPMRRRKGGGFSALASKEDADIADARNPLFPSDETIVGKPGLALADPIKESLEKIHAALFLVTPMNEIAEAIVREAVYLLTSGDKKAFDEFCDAVQWRMTALGDAFLDAVVNTLTPIQIPETPSRDSADRTEIVLSQEQNALVASLRHRPPPPALIEAYENTGMSYARAYHLARAEHHQCLLEHAGIPYWQAGILAVAENPEPVDFHHIDEPSDNPFAL